ncbi:MAG: hypothetical protein MI919_25840, partial [Holophagales bacterium]|nr:hypothetical protein [Holophagales bacterium]
FTDSTHGSATLHDVGTLRTSSGQRLGGPLTGIDTPTLLGVWNTAPYFHDGSAPELEDVLTVAGGVQIQAETGTATLGAQVVDQYVDLNNDDSVHGASFVELGGTGGTLTLAGVDGGPGGLGALEIRYSNSGATDFDVRVNGVSQNLVVPSAGNDPSWRHTLWHVVRIENVSWSAGPSNTVELISTRNWPNVTIDDVLISTAADLAAAEPHRRALSLSAQDRAELVAFLRQLDSTPEANDPPTLFADGFEAGNVSAWASSSP